MGSNMLSNIMGFDGMNEPSENYICAAVGVHTPMKLVPVLANLKSTFFGSYDRGLASNITRKLLKDNA